MSGPSTSTTLTLTTGGITLLGVLLSVGVTVAFGINATWWVRVLAGTGTTMLLILRRQARHLGGARSACEDRALDHRIGE